MARPRLSTARRIDLALLLLAAALLGGLAIWVYWPFLASYWTERMDRYVAQRAALKPVSELVDDLASVNATTRARAMSVLLSRSDPAMVPFLVSQLEHPDAITRAVIASALGRTGPHARVALPQLVDACSDESHHVRAAAASAIAQIDAQSHHVQSLMVRLLGDPDPAVGQVAKRALGRLTNKGIAAVTTGLAHEAAAIRAGAAAYLEELGPDAAAALEAIARILDDREPAVRLRAAAALGAIGTSAQPAVPLLIRTVDDPDADVAVAAATALRHIGDDSPQVVAALTGAARRPEDNVRIEAVRSLYLLDADTLALFIAALRDNNDTVRTIACHAIREFGPKADSAVEELIRLLKDDLSTVRGTAASTLGAIRARAEISVPALIDALRDTQIDASAAQALGKLGPQAQAALPQLIEMIQHPRPAYVAAQAIRRISPDDAERLATEFVEMLDDPRAATRSHAASVIHGLEPTDQPVLAALVPVIRKHHELRFNLVPLLGALKCDAADVVPTLTEILLDSDAVHQSLAARTLAEIGPSAHAAVPALLEKLQFEQAGSRPTHMEGEIARALGKIGSAHQAISVALIQSCEQALEFAESPESLLVSTQGENTAWTVTEVACRSIWALAEICPDQSRTMPVLERAIRSPDKSIRLTGVLALGRMRADSAESLRSLCDALSDPDTGVRIGAAVALGQIGPAARGTIPSLRAAADIATDKPPRSVFRRYGYVPEAADALRPLTLHEAIRQAIQQIDRVPQTPHPQPLSPR